MNWKLTGDFRETAAEYLSYASCHPAFKPWEIGDNQPRLAYDLACVAEDRQAREFSWFYPSFVNYPTRGWAPGNNYSK